MTAKRRMLVMAGLASIVLVACGDNNLFSGLADEDSPQAKLEKAQAALDDGDCRTALTLFTEMQAAAPERVDRRLDLSAAYLCQAGFDSRAFVEVAAEFGADQVSSNQLFQAIANETVALITDSWPQDLSAAETLLAEDINASPLEGFGGDADTQFNLAIVLAVKVVLTVTDILNYIDGTVDCAVSQGSGAFTNCEISAQNVVDIVNALEDADQLLDQLGVSSEIRDTVSTVLTDLDEVDGDVGDAVTCQDLTDYLANQGFDLSQVSCG